jgi:hypothetical protein
MTKAKSPPKSNLNYSSFLFTVGAFARLSDQEFVSVASKASLLRFALGATFKLANPELDEKSSFTFGLNFGPSDDAWKNDKSTVNQKTSWPVLYKGDPIELPVAGNLRGELQAKGYIYAHAGPYKYTNPKASDQTPGMTTMKDYAQLEVKGFPEKYFEQYRKNLGAKLNATSIKNARFSFACDILSSGVADSASYANEHDVVEYDDKTGVYTLTVSLQKAIFIDQITTSPTDVETSFINMLPEPKDLLKDPTKSGPPIPNPVEFSPITPTITGYDGLLENTGLRNVANLYYWLFTNPKAEKWEFDVGADKDLNTIFDNANKIGTALHNSDAFLEKESEYLKAVNELQIQNFYKNSLYPDKAMASKGILYDVAPAFKYRTIVLELDDLLLAPQSSEAAYVAINFDANFAPNAEVNKVNYFTQGNSSLNRRVFLRRLLKQKLINPQNISNLTFFAGAQQISDVIYKGAQEHIQYGPIEKFGVSDDGSFPNDGKTFSYSLNIKTNLDSEAKKQNLSEIKNSKMWGGVSTRSFEDIINGKFASYEVLGYKITKSTRPKGDADYANSIISDIYIFQGEAKNKEKTPVTYYDTQILPGIEYFYEIEQIVIIYGNSILYKTETSDPADIIFTGKGILDEISVEGKKYTLPSKDSDKLPIYANFKGTNPWNGLEYSKTKVNSKSNKAQATKWSPGIPLVPELAYKIPIKPEVVDFQPVVAMPLKGFIGKVGIKKKPSVITPLKEFPTMPLIKIRAYSRINNKVLIQLENNVGGYAKKITDETIIKYGEKVFLKKDEEIQFTPKAKIEVYYLYRTSRLPLSYKDFPSTPYKIIDATKKWYQDEVEPNKQYYYYLMGVTAAGALSDESYPLKVKIYDEDGAIYGLIEGLDFEREKEKRDKKLKTTLTTRSLKTKRFKRLIRIAPAFLQGAPNPSGDNEYIGYVEPSFGIKGIDKRLWSDPEKTLDPNLGLPTGLTIKPKFKFRIRSLKSRRKFDINILYTAETKHQGIIPASAEKVYEGPLSAADAAELAAGAEAAAAAKCPPGKKFVGTDPNTGQPICEGSMVDF